MRLVSPGGGGGGGTVEMPWMRNPASIVLSYYAVESTLHSKAVQWTYTVPAGRRAMLQHMEAAVMHESIPAVSGRLSAGIDVDLGAGLTTVLWAGGYPNRVGPYVVASAPMVALPAGTVINGWTENLNNGGFQWLMVAAMLTEFDP